MPKSNAQNNNYNNILMIKNVPYFLEMDATSIFFSYALISCPALMPNLSWHHQQSQALNPAADKQHYIISKQYYFPP